MDLDKGLELLTTWNTLLYTLAVIAIVTVVRLPVEKLWPAVSAKKWWREVLVPLLPLGFGAAGGLGPSFPFPEGIRTLYARIVYGLVCGFVSAYLFAYLKKVFASKGIEIPGFSTKPAATPEALKPVEVPADKLPQLGGDDK